MCWSVKCVVGGGCGGGRCEGESGGGGGSGRRPDTKLDAENKTTILSVSAGAGVLGIDKIDREKESERVESRGRLREPSVEKD
jgi:hypothetical protein